MKYLFVAGLEHSGTTLVSQLVSASDRVVSLGEVGQFLSRSHMQQYLARWGAFDDVTRCSCGLDWSDCPFWSGLMPFNGAFEDSEISLGYAEILRFLANQTDFDVVVDSSKSLRYLAALQRGVWQIDAQDVQLVPFVIAKNPASFAHSIGRKDGASRSVLSYWQTMNWWRSEYEQFLEFPGISGAATVLTYDQLCLDTDKVLIAISTQLGNVLQHNPDVTHKRSHIALGNKDFTERNRQRIKYDDAWKQNWRARLAYAINIPAFRTFQRLDRLANACLANAVCTKTASIPP